MPTVSYRLRVTALLAPLLLGACQTEAPPPITTMAKIDLARFMGDWYVIANIPTFVEKNAFNPVESYQLDKDGSILTTFTFREGGFDGEQKTYRPRGYVIDRDSNAIWGMEFIWPIKADYRILYVDEDYSQTVIGRQKRDYVWIMARTPVIPDADYERLLKLIAEQGYDVNLVRRVPQQWRR